MIFRNLKFKSLLALYKTPILFDILLSKRSMWFFQFKSFHQLELLKILVIVLFLFLFDLFLMMADSEEFYFFVLICGKVHAWFYRHSMIVC